MQKTSSFSNTKVFTTLSWILFAASLMPLLVFAYLGTFTRYLADDYATAGAVLRLGFWQAQLFWYNSWHGNFMYAFTVSLAELAGVGIVRWLPFASLLVWGGSLYWALRQFFCALKLPVARLWTGILAAVLIYGTIKSFRDYAQIVYWQTVIAHYQTSLILFSLGVGLFTKRFYLSGSRPLAVWEYFAWGLTFFLSGGYSETWVIIQISLTSLVFLAYLLEKNHPLRTDILLLMLFGFLISWAALYVIASSPGNNNRDTVLQELSVPMLFNALYASFKDVPRFLLEWVTGFTSLVVLIFLSGFCAAAFTQGFEKPLRFVRLAFTLFVGAYILLWAGFVPQFAVMGLRPVDRAAFMPMFLFVWAFLLTGFFAGAQLSALNSNPLKLSARIISLTALAFLLFWVPVRTSISLLETAPVLRLYAQLWDERDAALRLAAQRGEQDVLVDSLKHNPALHAMQTSFSIEADLQDDPENWINQVAASYYGLKTISLRR